MHVYIVYIKATVFCNNRLKISNLSAIIPQECSCTEHKQIGSVNRRTKVFIIRAAEPWIVQIVPLLMLLLSSRSLYLIYTRYLCYLIYLQILMNIIHIW